MHMQKYISAGAGSGKTYRITTEVAKLIKDGKLKPDQVIMTTYTKAAAQELREKAKAELIKIGCPEKAFQMEHALIGTVHSIANTFLTKYWYLLGILPNVNPVDDEDLQYYRDLSLRNLLSDENRQFLYELREKYNIRDKKSGADYDFWKKDLVEVLNFMLWYQIDDVHLNNSYTITTESLIKQLEPVSAGIAADSRRYAEIVFNLAKKWRDKYRQFKDEHHIIDYNDMEVMFLNLLEKEVVRNDIKDRYQIIYVDEFQDSNPIQVRIFQEISSLIDACYVGDKKQAIYSFRGADTELTAAVADSIDNTESLPHSYRSIKPLVDLSNAVFSRIFGGMSDVELTMPTDINLGNRDRVNNPRRIWKWNDDADLAFQIQQFILKNRNLKYEDIAVLARFNDSLDKLAEELRKLNVPVCREDDNIRDSRTGRLIKAILTLVATPGNLLARAELAYLTQPGYHLTKIIEDRLDDIHAQKHNTDYLERVPIIQRINNLRKEVSTQSIGALLQTLVIELDLYALVRQWDNAATEEANLQVFIDLARKYEENSARIAQPATIAGFINYFCNQKVAGAADSGGINLLTYHKSKGLEWKVVIMLSLDTDAEEFNTIAKKSMLGCHFHRTELPSPQDPIKPMTISLVRNLFKKEQDEEVTKLLQKHEYWQSTCATVKNELARLLYVGVTRARNILILAAQEKNNIIRLDWFKSTGLNMVQQSLTTASMQDILGVGMPFYYEQFDHNQPLPWEEIKSDHVFHIAKDPTPPSEQESQVQTATDNRFYVSPSQAGKGKYELGKIINNKEIDRIKVPNETDENGAARMGTFIHQVFCCMDDGITTEQINQLRASYGYESEDPDPEKLKASWDYLKKKMTETYGKSISRHHERSFRHLDDNGRMVSGEIDLVWETDKGCVIVDYKTCPGNYKEVFSPGSKLYAGKYGDQLNCYQSALQAAGNNVLARLIYYPVTRFLVEVSSTLLPASNK